MPESTTTLPEVSVVIPAWNAATTIDQQLAALHRQATGTSFEILVCDNGSSDETFSIVDGWRVHLPNLRIVDASLRRGAAAARNVGALHARAPMLLFCDADDVADEHWVERMSEALDQHDLVAGQMEHHVLNGKETWDEGWDEPLYRESFMPWMPAGGSGNLGVRADVFHHLRGFDESRLSGEDTDFCWRAQLAGFDLVPVPDAIMHIRKRNGFRAAWRQGFAKGTAVRQLVHDYSAVRASFVAEEARWAVGTAARTASSPRASTWSSRLDRVRRAPRRLRRVIASPNQLRRECGEIARGLGYRFGRIDWQRPAVPPTGVSQVLARRDLAG
jgi:cellulose synthase/poly-beta-1,6-N-acetylglucosamine synthase-like glycosyltransferase